MLYIRCAVFRATRLSRTPAVRYICCSVLHLLQCVVVCCCLVYFVVVCCSDLPFFEQHVSFACLPSGIFVAVSCSVLQCVAVSCSVLWSVVGVAVWRIELQCVAVSCHFSSNTSLSHACRQVYLSQRVVVCCGMLPRVTVCCSVMQCSAVWCILLQCVVVCCSFLSNTSLLHACRQVYLLQRVAMCCPVFPCVAM